MNSIFIINKTELEGKSRLRNRLILLSQHVEEKDNVCFFHAQPGKNFEVIELLMEYWIVYDVQFKPVSGDSEIPKWIAVG